MHLLLIGATGFLGSPLARTPLAQGHRLIALKRRSSDLRRLAGVQSELVFYAVEGLDWVRPFTEHGLYKYLNGYALSKRQFMEWGRQWAEAQKIHFVNIRLEHLYGPGDDESKFTTQVIKSCLANVPELPLTPGEQRRDFISVEDAVAAYGLLLEKVGELGAGFQPVGLGGGQAVTIREFVEMADRLTRSRTRLAFGALPYREREAMESSADTGRLAARIAAAESARVERWLERILTANRPDERFE